MEKKKSSILSLIVVFFAILISGCGASGQAIENNKSTYDSLKEIGEMPLSYATQFKVKYYENDYVSIDIADGNSYVLVPKGGEEISLDEEDPTFIHRPLDNIYLAASSAMDLFRELDAVDRIKSCSTKAEDYYIEGISEKITKGEITYVGKYNSPDYERLLTLDTKLAIESTMIYHNPKTKEELESLGIPVLVERSSYEENPLGRLEWIKLYGLLLGQEKEAEEIFNAQIDLIDDVCVDVKENKDKPKVVFFYVSSNGYVNVRKPGDYVSKMIEMAGGEYALESLRVEEENALSTVNISWEDFYMYAKDADILIYNGTIDGGIPSIDALLRDNEMFNSFKAIKENRVYCSLGNMYQETSKMGSIIAELASVISDSGNDTDFQGKYLLKLQ